jgi:hypothetical protein
MSRRFRRNASRDETAYFDIVRGIVPTAWALLYAWLAQRFKLSAVEARVVASSGGL